MNLQLEQEEALEMLKDLPPAKQALVSRQADTNAADYPDTSLAYPKGAWFLHTLEQRAGRAAFDQFLRGWFDQHAFQSVTTSSSSPTCARSCWRRNPRIMSDAELDEWIHGPGIPASGQRAVSQRLAKLNAAIDGWTKGTVSTAQLNAQNWNAVEWMKFLNDIDKKADAAKLAELDRAYGLAKSTNNEVAFRFYRAAVHAGYRDVRPDMEAFLMSVGRQKFVVPLYAALREKAEDRTWAEGVYKKARERYHPETQSSVDKAMGQTMMTRSSSGLLKHIAGAVLVAFCGAGLATAQTAAAPTTAAAPAYNLDADVQRVLKTFDVPGIAIAVVKDGKVVVTQGFGVRKLGDPTPVDGKTLFEIASNSKAFTAAGLAMLVDQGKLNWDDPVIKHLPDFRMYDSYVTAEMTVRDLLTHRSGLGLGAVT